MIDSAPGAECALGQTSEMRIVRRDHRHAHRFGEHRGDRNVSPFEVGRQTHKPIGEPNQPRNRNTHADDPVGGTDLAEQ